MEIKLRGTARYAIACPTSMGVRITPENRMPVQNSTRFIMQSTSAETNVLNVTSSLGRECLALTKFVEGSPVAQFIQGEVPNLPLRAPLRGTLVVGLVVTTRGDNGDRRGRCWCT